MSWGCPNRTSSSRPSASSGARSIGGAAAASCSSTSRSPVSLPKAKVSGVTVPLTSSSPRPVTISTIIAPLVPGCSVNMTPAYSAGTILCTTTPPRPISSFRPAPERAL